MTMTSDETLELAHREACAAHTWLFEEWWEKNWEGMGEIADDAGKFIAKAAWDAATGYERDACANVCESLFDMNGGSCAEAVRLRSNVKLTGGAPGIDNEEPLPERRPVERRVGRKPDEDSQKRGPFDDIFAGCRLTQEQFDEHERVCEERARKEREDASNAPR